MVKFEGEENQTFRKTLGEGRRKSGVEALEVLKHQKYPSEDGSRV